MTLEQPNDRVQALVDELVEARRQFAEAIADVDPALMLSAGLVGDWSARDLLAHVGYWAGHATQALHQAELGGLADFGEDDLDVDERNEVVARIARETDLATVRQREEAAFDAFVARLKRVNPEALDDRVAYGDTLEQVIRDDGSEHYREHTLDLRAWFDGAGEPRDPDDEHGLEALDDADEDPERE